MFLIPFQTPGSNCCVPTGQLSALSSIRKYPLSEKNLIRVGETWKNYGCW